MPEAAIIGVSGDPLAELLRRAWHGIDEHHAGSGASTLAAGVADLIREMGNRIQARGSGVGSVLNCALHTSAVKPIDTIAKQMWRFNARLPTCS